MTTTRGHGIFESGARSPQSAHADGTACWAGSSGSEWQVCTRILVCNRWGLWSMEGGADHADGYAITGHTRYALDGYFGAEGCGGQSLPEKGRGRAKERQTMIG